MKLIIQVICICLSIVNAVSASPDIEQWKTDKGVKTLFVAAPELPMIDIALTFDAGSGRDGNLSGLSQLTHSLLNAGSGDLDADAIAEKFEDVGAQYGVSINVDRSSVSLRSLSDEKLFDQALSIRAGSPAWSSASGLISASEASPSRSSCCSAVARIHARWLRAVMSPASEAARN